MTPSQRKLDSGIQVRSRNKSHRLSCTPQTTIKELRPQLYSLFKIAPVRQRLQYHHGGEKPTVLSEDNRTLSDYNIATDGSLTLILKDLGPQMEWRTVFLLEYAGPLIIHQLAVNFKGFGRLSQLQLVAWLMVTTHYMKRLYESVFVHRFSHATMPATGMAKNCVHYWLIGGVLLSHAVYFGGGTEGTVGAGKWGWVALFALCELGNLYAHLKLRWLRPAGTRKRAIPEGFPFNWVSCPNYLFEALAWVSYAAFVNKRVAWVFALLGGGQMWLWAQKKHNAYLKEFKEYPRNRTPMIPFIC